MRFAKFGIAAIALAAGLAGTARSAEVDEAARAKVTPIVRGLGSDDFSEREKAQKALIELGPEFAPAIAEAAEKAKSEEVKAGLELALSTIAEQTAINPPAISIGLNNATGTDVAAALTKATGKKFEIASGHTGDAAQGVTLKMEHKSFWEVIGALNEKWPIDLADTQYDRKYLINVSDAPMDLYKRASVHGGVAFMPVKFTKQSADDGLFSLRVALDPRVRMLKQGSLTITEMLDQDGKKLEPISGLANLSIARGWVTTYSLGVKFPDRPPTSISSIKGEMKFILLVAAETQEIADLSKAIDKPIELGGYKIKFSKADVTEGTPEIMFTTWGQQTGNNTAVPAGVPRLETVDGEFVITDANGKYVSTVQVAGNGGGGGMRWGRNGAFVGPLKGTFTAPKAVKEVTIPFSFKDLPAVNSDK